MIFRIFHSLGSGIFEMFDLQKVDCWKKAKKQMAIIDRDLDRVKKIAIDDQNADLSCLGLKSVHSYGVRLKMF